MRRGQHNGGLTGGGVDKPKEIEPEVVVAPTVIELQLPEFQPGIFSQPAPDPEPSPPRVVKPVKPKIQPKGK